MKKFIMTLLCSASFFIAAAQTEYPQFSIDSAGQKLVVITLEQAQSLDNQTDLLPLFEKLNGEVGRYDSICLKVVGEKDALIGELKIQITNISKGIADKDSMLMNREEKILRLTERNSVCEEQLKTREKEIELHKKEVKRVKKNWAAGGGVVGLLAGIVLTLILAK